MPKGATRTYIRYFNFFNKGIRPTESVNEVLDFGFNVSEIVNDDKSYKNGIKYVESPCQQ